MDESENMGVSGAADHTYPGDPFDIKTSAVAIIDAEGLIAYWSRGAQDLLGYPADDVVQRPARLLWPGRVPTAMVSRLRRIDRAGDAVIAVRHRAGHTVRLAVRVCPLLAAGGSRDWLVLACDVADRHRHEWYEAVVQGLLEQSPIGVAALDTRLRYRWVNRALAGVEGHPVDTTSVGDAAGEAVPETSPVVTRHARQTLISGQSQVTIEHVSPRRGPPRSRLRSFFPLRDGTGRTLGICYAALDVTAQDPSRERLLLLNTASEHIGTTLDLDRTVQELAEVVVPRIADFVAIDLLDVVQTEQGPPAASVLRPAVLRHSAHLSIQENQPRMLAGIGEAVQYPSGSPQQLCLATGKAVRQSVGPSTPWLADTPLRWTGTDGFDAHTHLVVPLRARGITMGVVTLLRWKNPDAFTEDDQLLVEDVVARAAVCVDNARRFAREHQAALTLQTSLLPSALPPLSAVEVAYRYLPADTDSGVGGDWFDVIPLSGARVALVVGDVIGHGLHAAASMGRLRAAVQTLADLDLSPDELLAHVDDLVVRLSEEAEASDEGPPAVGATCVYVVYDPVSGTMSVARAGHPSPAIAHLDEPVEFPDIPTGPLLGIGGLPFESVEMPVEEGSVIALYTDGLISASDQDVDVGLERLCFTLAHPDRPLEEICDTMVRILLPDRPRDDVAFLVARTHILSRDRVASWEVPVDPSAVHKVRDDVSHQLSLWGLEEASFTTELIVSELVTNAIRHACGPIGLRLIHERVLICEVSDGGSTSPHLRRARTTDEGGRGLFLVAQLAQRWGTRYTDSGKTIWTEQPLPGQTSQPPRSSPSLPPVPPAP
ncbi:SpoIIE family protein phosphatase [Streptomyces thermogriseus]|uniref:SpoIIE family protein phosphatase n=1 Tax=Streptomyces thermogriseus TaxID=75292 RepID=A0ABN1T5J0_9ACTN